MREETKIWLYGGMLGFIFGVAASSLWFSGIWVAAFALLLAVALGLLVCFLHNRKIALIGVLILCTAALGALRFEVAQRGVSIDQTLEGRIGQNIEIEGVLFDEPDIREHNQRLKVETAATRLLVVADMYPAVAYGDRIRVRGVLERPKNFEGDMGRVFNYVGFLEKEGIHYLIRNAHVEVVAEGEGNPIRELLFGMKRRFLDNLARLVPEPESALLSGLLLGGKQSLGSELIQAFTISSLIHIVVLSGFNMTIIALALRGILSRFLSARLALAFGALGILLFMLMVGLSVTVVRAGAMALLGLLAIVLGRRYNILHALFLVGFAMVLWNPYTLVFDPSFQLSFIATFGLITLSPIIQPRLVYVTEKWGIREIVAATISTQIAVLPMLLWMTGNLSLVALPANLLVLPFIPATMLLGFLAGSAAFVHEVFAMPFAWGADILLFYEILMAKTAARLPFAHFTLSAFPFWLVTLFYAALVFIVSKRAAIVSQFRAFR